MAIKQTVRINASAEQIDLALMSGEKFSKVTGASATIAEDAGGVFSCFGGQVTGRG